MHDGLGSMFFGGGLMWILWIILIVVLVYVLKDIAGSRGKGSSEDEALEILRQRYARGEIDEQEYEQRKRELQK